MKLLKLVIVDDEPILLEVEWYHLSRVVKLTKSMII